MNDTFDSGRWRIRKNITDSLQIVTTRRDDVTKLCVSGLPVGKWPDYLSRMCYSKCHKLHFIVSLMHRGAWMQVVLWVQINLSAIVYQVHILCF